MDFKIHKTAVLKQEKEREGIRRAGRYFWWTVWILCCLVMLNGCSKKQPKLSEVVQKTVEYQLKTVERPQSASIGGEWTVISVLRSGEKIPDSYGEIYLSNLKKRLKEEEGVLSETKYTEYARAVLALAALGQDPQDVDGYDLLAPLLDLEGVTKQGINGAAFALQALDAAAPEIAANTSDSEPIGIAKAELLQWILERELPNGGFTLKEEETEHADADITAMVLQALAPYQEQETIAEVIDRAVNVLADMQCEDGMYESWGEKNCETAAQVVIALSALGIDCESDARFIKGENNLYEVLLKFYDGNGGFAHVQGKDADPMATDQALCALDALQNR